MAVSSESKIKSNNDLSWEQYLLLDNQQAANTTSDEVDARNAMAMTLMAVGNSSAVSGGTIVLEAAPSAGYTGAWKQLATVTPSGASVVATSVSLGATNGFPCRVVRARLSTQISNGNVDVYLVVQR